MLTIQGLTKRFHRQPVLDAVSFTVGAGAIVGLVGMSGSGKSTIAKCILGLERADRGTIHWHGAPLTDRTMRARKIQAVFQDPRASLNPRWTIRQILAEPLDNGGLDLGALRETKLRTVLERVALDKDLLGRYPHELSTGQCQRVCIARAIAPGPDLLVLDEPLSALDVSVQARLIELLMDLHRNSGIAYLLITHDFAVVGDICQKIVVLNQGRVVEEGTVADVLERPDHAYTRSLLQDALRPPKWATG